MGKEGWSSCRLSLVAHCIQKGRAGNLKVGEAKMSYFSTLWENPHFNPKNVEKYFPELHVKCLMDLAGKILTLKSNL